MVALKPRPDEAQALAHTGGEPPRILHVTLAYLGDTEGPLLDLTDRLREIAAAHGPLVGTVGGVAAFGSEDGGHPGVLLPDVPGLVEVRQAVCDAVTATPGISYSTEHGFTAHTTVVYTEPDSVTADGLQAEGIFPDRRAIGLPLHFDAIYLVRGDEVLAELPLVGSQTVTAAARQRRPFCLPAELRRRTDPVRRAVIENVVGTTLGKYRIAYDVTNPFIDDVLSRVGSHITYISTTTQLQVMDIIRASYEEGLSVPDTAKAIRRVMRRISKSRAELIAQTELAGAVNGASVAAARIVGEATGTTYWKEWLTAPGAKRPRHEHYMGLNGQTVRMDDYFQVGTSQLLYPGDPSGPAHDIARCRCSIAYTTRARRTRSRTAGATNGQAVMAPPPVPAETGTRALRRSVTAAADWTPPAGEEVLPINCETPAAEVHKPPTVTPAEQLKAPWTKEMLEQERAWRVPPAPKSASLKKAGGYSSDTGFGTNTAMGDWAEDRFAAFVGGKKLVRVPGQMLRQQPFDVQSDGYLIEVKAVSTESSRLAAWPKPEEIEAKQAYAEEAGLDAAIVMPVLDRDAGIVHYYWRTGVKGGRLSERTGWRYLGSEDVETWPTVLDEGTLVTARPRAALTDDSYFEHLPAYSRYPLDTLTVPRAKAELRRLNRYNRSLKKRQEMFESGARRNPGPDVPEKIAASDRRLAELRAFIAEQKPSTPVPYVRLPPQRKVAKIELPPIGDRYILSRNSRGRWQAYDALNQEFTGRTYGRKWVAEEGVAELNAERLPMPRPKPGKARFTVTTEDGKSYVVHAKDGEAASRQVRKYTGVRVTNVRELGVATPPKRVLPKPIRPPEELPPRRRVESEILDRPPPVPSTRVRDAYSPNKRIRRLQEAYDQSAERQWGSKPFAKGAADFNDVVDVIGVGRELRDAVIARMRGASNKMRADPAFRRKLILDVLGEVRDMGEGSLGGNASIVFRIPTASPYSISNAAENVPRDWIVQWDTGSRPIQTAVGERGSWNHATDVLTLPQEMEQREPVAMHEFGHVSEDRIPYLRQLEQSFYEWRTEGEDLVSLKELQPYAGYNDDEMTREDLFSSPFMGKDYGTGIYEIVAMGLEDIFYGVGARGRFPSQTIWDTDADHRDFILGLLVML